LRSFNVATCHGMSNLGLYPHLVLRGSMSVYPETEIGNKIITGKSPD